MNDLGYILKRLRTVYGASGQEFSKLLEISPSYLSELENGKKNISVSLLTKYSDILGIKASTILLLAEDDDQLNQESKITRLLQPLLKRILLNNEKKE